MLDLVVKLVHSLNMDKTNRPTNQPKGNSTMEIITDQVYSTDQVAEGHHYRVWKADGGQISYLPSIAADALGWRR